MRIPEGLASCILLPHDFNKSINPCMMRNRTSESAKYLLAIPDVVGDDVATDFGRFSCDL
jgi:hypothetical protein